MGAFQRQIGDMVELTPEGERKSINTKIIMQMRQNH